ncbi:MAG: UPF0149 family protein [Gammaproteobacteria bacterium]
MPASDFEALTQALTRAGALGEPAEAHGHLCGLACALGPAAEPPWVAELLADCAIGPAARDALIQELKGIAVQNIEALEAGDMSLQLALPDDADPLDSRAAALGLWCQGFMHGLSQGAAAPATIESGVTGEIIGDFVEISRAELSQEETLAEAESAYAELVEFVRVSVQLIFEELHAERSGGTSH